VYINAKGPGKQLTERKLYVFIEVTGNTSKSTIYFN
jgi:hypothetical protein